MTIVPCVQRDDAWVTARLGRLTASRAADMLATIKSGEAAGRRNLRVQLVLERLTKRSHDRDFLSQAMQDGIDREEQAAFLYECLAGHLLQPVGFVQHDELLAGCSPDGVVNDFEGIVELKSPQPAAHLEYLKTGIVPGDYLKQIEHALWITGASWCDWLSYQPDFPEHLQARLVRVFRDDRAVAAYETKARAFLTEVDLEVRTVETLADPMAAFRASVGVA